MRKLLLPVLILSALVAIPSGRAYSQTREQKEALDRYLKEKERTVARETAEKPAEIFERNEPSLPPEKIGAGIDDTSPGSSTSGNPSRFGLSIFADAPGDFITSTEIPVPPGYTLGPGDHLIVNLWGSVDLSLELVIDREGKAFIPRAGELVLWGLTVEESEKRIRNLLDMIYSNFEMNIILGKIRSITVYVSGEVVRPGAYTVNSLYTLFNTLYLAGGPTEGGSLRDIRLLRNGKIVSRYDLYGLLLEGRSEDIKLESNDIVFVPVAGPLVTIRGQVKRPGLYEILGGERLSDLIDLAGGLPSSAYLGNVELQRFDGNMRKVIFNLNISSLEPGSSVDMSLADGDLVSIRKVYDLKEMIVHISGEVRYPGEYEYRGGMRVIDLVDAGSLLPTAYLDRVFLTRMREDLTREVFQLDLASIFSSADTKEAVPVEDEKNGGSGGDRVIKWNMKLAPGDSIVIFNADMMRDRETVTVEGEVRRPGRYNFAKKMTVSDIIFLAGGLKKDAWLLQADLARIVADSTRKSEVITVGLVSAIEESHGPGDIVLEPGDALYIRKTPMSGDHEKVVLIGEVLFPGTYVLENENETLTDLIDRAGGFTKDAFLPGAVFERVDIVKELQNRHIGDVIDALRESEVDTSGGVPPERIFHYEINTDKMNRIIIDLPVLVQGGDPEENIVLRPGDRITIPGFPSGINVLGAVASSGTIKFREGESADYYIERAGGFTRSAARKEVRILKADGRVIKKKAMSVGIEIGDAIIVPEKVIRDRDWLGFFQTSVGIIASAMTTVFIVTKL